MKFSKSIVCLTLSASAYFANANDAVKYIDPFIGTAGDRGQLHPAATLPFGMVQMGPETPGRPHSGYDFNADSLEGFAHTRTAGVGCRGSGGSVLVRADYSLPEINHRAEAPTLSPVTINKRSEVAEPGYYAVNYGENNIRAEMTVSRSSGWQRYTFPKSGEVFLTIDAVHAHHENHDGNYAVDNQGRVFGMSSGPTVCKLGAFKIYYSLVTDKTPLRIENIDEFRTALVFKVDVNDSIVVHTGLSSVDTDTAESARRIDAETTSFDEARLTAEREWHDVSQRIVIDANDETKKLFYSHLYHVYQSPSLITGSVNSYRDSNNQLASAKERHQYFGWSIWDNFRTQLPLLTIIEPRRMQDITASLAALYFEGKENWATLNEPLPTVRTEHSAIVLLDAWQKGIRSFNPEKLLPKLALEADNMPRNSPDQILEATYDDWAVSRFANIVGDAGLEKQYTEKAKSYRSVWSEKFQTITDKSDIMHGDGLYEGTLWQYRWFVPHDTQWVVNRLGGREIYNDQLTHFFDHDLYNAGNQPDIQTPFLFSLTGEPWKTQKIVHQLLQTETKNWYGTHDKKVQPYVGKIFQTKPEGSNSGDG